MTDRWRRAESAGEAAPRSAIEKRSQSVSLDDAVSCRERELFIDNLLVRIHFIIVMIRWTGLAPWEVEFPFFRQLPPGGVSARSATHSTNDAACESEEGADAESLVDFSRWLGGSGGREGESVRGERIDSVSGGRSKNMTGGRRGRAGKAGAALWCWVSGRGRESESERGTESFRRGVHYWWLARR